MMKQIQKTIIVLVLLLVANMDTVTAQCTPDNCLANLPAYGGICDIYLLTGRVGSAYSDFESFHITTACFDAGIISPADVGTNIKLVRYKNFTFSNLPTGLTGATNQSVYNAPANGCLSFYGTPTTAGVFAIKPDFLVDFNAYPFSTNCSGLALQQNDNLASGLNYNNPPDLNDGSSLFLTILPKPNFTIPKTTFLVNEPAVTLSLDANSTTGGTFSGPGVSGSSFNPATAGVGTHTLKYQVSAQQGSAIAAATDSFSVSVTVTGDPYVSVTGNTSITTCGGGSTVLTASGTSPFTWYNAATGGSLLYTGITYTTPILTSNTSYWVSGNGSERTQVNITVADNEKPTLIVPIFAENWNSNSFNTNGWSFSSSAGNWAVNESYIPAGGSGSCASFNWEPGNSNYTFALTSPIIDASQRSNITIDYLLKLDNFSTSTLEEFAVEYKTSQSVNWTLLENFSNANGSFSIARANQILSNLDGQTFQIRFRVYGIDSENINGWGLDNIVVNGNIISSYAATSNLGCEAAVNVATPQFADNCGILHTDAVRSDGLDLNSPYLLGVTTVSWTATDFVGNVSVPFVQTVTVTPMPSAASPMPFAASPATQSICSGDAITNIVLSGGLEGSTYSWTRNGISGGIPSSGTGDISGSLNTTSSSADVTFTITPNYNGCSGAPVQAIVTVLLCTEIPTGPLSFCKGATVAAAGSGLKFYTALTGGSPLSETTALVTKNYFVIETINNVGSNPRVPVAITVNALPATPTALVLTNEAAVLPATPATVIKKVGVYVGAEVALKLTATAVGATSYEWTLPAGVTLADGITTGTVTTELNTINVKFSASAATSSLVLSVKSVNASGCSSSAAKTLTLTRAIPVAPTTLKMNNGLNFTAITSFAKYMGTDTILRLTAAGSATATSYVWDLPEGVTRVTALDNLTAINTIETTVPEIFVTLKGVTSGNTYNYLTLATVPVSTNVLRIGVYGKNGTGLSATVNATLANPETQSTARLLTLTATKPAAPATLKLYDLAVSATAAITDITKYVSTETELKLEAKASALASSYTWYLPYGVYVTNGSATEVGVETNIYTSTSNVITVNFGNFPDIGSFSKVLGVKAVNAIAESVKVNTGSANTATLVTVTAAPPAAVVTPTGSLKICATTASSVTYTIATVAKNALDYAIIVPDGCTITVGTVTSEYNSTTIPAVANASFTVNYPAGFVVTSANPKKILIASLNHVAPTEKFLTLTNTGAICSGKIAPEAAVDKFSVVAYPNPSSSNFNLQITSSSAKNVEVKVYDVIGKLIHKMEVSPSKVARLQIGDRYPSGVYNVIVSQGTEVKTLRVIKQ